MDKVLRYVIMYVHVNNIITRGLSKSRFDYSIEEGDDATFP